MAMTDDQKKRIADVMATEHVAHISTLGEEWPSLTLEAFAETPELDIVIIVGESTERYQNASKRPNTSFLVVKRFGDISKFQIIRISGRGVANEVEKNSAEWETLKAIFLKKNPFEEPFFQNPALKMLRIRPKWIKFAEALNPPFTVEF